MVTVNREKVNNALTLVASEANRNSKGRTWAYEKVAKLFNVKAITIRRIADRSVIELINDRRLLGTAKVVDYLDVVYMIESGKYKTQREVAKKLGCSDSTVSRICMKHRLEKANAFTASSNN